MSTKHRKDDQFIKKPIYKGGIKAMREFIGKNLKYPKEALANKIEGSVQLNYDVDYKGVVTKTQVISGIGYGCDEEASRIIKLFKFEVPKNPRKLKVSFHKKIKINFKLPKERPIKKTQINYQIKITPPSSSKSKTINYTINI